jgi:hypothetical protein
MAIRKLINMLDGLTVGSDPSSVRPDNVTPARFLNGAQLNLIGKGDVQSVTDVSAVVVINGNPVPVKFATDEPLRVGQQVWVSRSIDGEFVVHGSVR